MEESLPSIHTGGGTAGATEGIATDGTAAGSGPSLAISVTGSVAPGTASGCHIPSSRGVRGDFTNILLAFFLQKWNNLVNSAWT
jgi:hypothetical protein